MPLVHETVLQWCDVFDDLWSIFFLQFWNNHNVIVIVIVLLLNNHNVFINHYWNLSYFGSFFLPTLSYLPANCCHFFPSSFLFISISTE